MLEVLQLASSIQMKKMKMSQTFSICIGSIVPLYGIVSSPLQLILLVFVKLCDRLNEFAVVH